jgi:citrate synthase
METYYKKLAKLVIEKNPISQELYDRYNVKHGLRNQDGSGVVVGLTDISKVIGYQKVEDAVLPVKGDLLYRGISITDIAKGIEEENNRNAFAETTYLLLFGVLPKKKELESFSRTLHELSALPKDFTRNILSTYHTPDIMNLIARSILTLYSKDSNPDELSPENVVRQGMELIAKLPTLIAYSYRIIKNWYHGKHLILRRSHSNLNLAENFLYKLRENGKFTEMEASVLNMCLVLHAEHGGGNNSTFTTRVVSSTGTDTYSAIAAAIGSLKGPLHGGANLRVTQMMEDLRANVRNITSERQVESYLAKILRGKAGDKSGKIYGFGHAVYTLSDPRAVILKKFAKEFAGQQNASEEYNLYLLVEKLAPRVFSHIKKSTKVVSPNVDFYSGFVYKCMNIPKEIYTPLFAMARVSGWIAHRIEEVAVSRRIIRPAYRTVVHPQNYVALKER